MGWYRVDFRQFRLKFDQFLTLKIPKFSKPRVRFLSHVRFNSLEPFIALWNRIRAVVYLKVWVLNTIESTNSVALYSTFSIMLIWLSDWHVAQTWIQSQWWHQLRMITKTKQRSRIFVEVVELTVLITLSTQYHRID